MKPPQKCSNLGKFCGGKLGVKCCGRLTCQLSDQCCDMGGTCIPPPLPCANLLERCGQGIRCCPDYQCVGGDPTAPDPIDRYGICRPLCSNETGVCGTLLGYQCCDGLVCEAPPQCCDFPGVCRRCQLDNEPCGGFGGFQCCTGYTCQQSNPVIPGTCQRTCNDIGGTCAGFAGFQCCPGLTCNVPNQCCDFAGTCEAMCITDGQPCTADISSRCCTGYTCNATADSPGVCAPSCIGEFGTCDGSVPCCILSDLGLQPTCDIIPGNSNGLCHFCLGEGAVCGPAPGGVPCCGAFQCAGNATLQTCVPLTS